MPNHRRDSWLPVLTQTALDANEYLAEGADLLIAAVSDSEVFDNVPIVSTAIKILGIKDAFHRNRLKRNVKMFLEAVRDEDRAKLELFFANLQNSNLADDFSDTLITLLIDAEKPIKISLVGRLIAASCQGHITDTDLNLLSQIILSASVPALQSLTNFYTRSEGRHEATIHPFAEEFLLSSTGLAGRYGTAYRVSPLGQALYKFGFEGLHR